MTVIVPFTRLEVPVQAALDGRDDVAFAYVGTSDDAYWRLLRDVWGRGETFVIVEHDVVAPPGAIEAMLACPRRWCAVPYPDIGTLNVGHGLTKYDASLLADYPTLVADLHASAQHWRYLDSWVQSQLHAHFGEPLPHWHWPAADHLKKGVDYEFEFGRCETCGLPLRFAELRGGPGNTSCAAGHPVRYWEAQHFDRALGRV